MAEETRPQVVRRLYPFLYGGPAARGDEPPGDGDQARRADGHAVWSTEVKADEIVRLRRQVGDMYADRLAACAEQMAERFAAGGRLFTFGNGGSSTDAQDMATCYLNPPHGRPLPALSLTTDVAVVTALSNDVGFDIVFARQIAALARPGDMAVGLSTSGGSLNLVHAFQEAGRRDMLTVGLAGYQGGRLAELAELDVLDHLFVVPSSSVHRIQEAQTTVYHVLWEITQQVLGSAAAARPPGAALR
ncbi:D-sedoheptulose-7-phosphate isomerase [Sphaerisporangium krabiense]|uniref:D-sedoheptulose 7-phosphate isomerase n=1 Tax=Sphaerisporangium krabiense TaxID=763782 RepID=A0A7W8Z662_9ACTN|nr:SIS domain-containing protein [Sphaerisporangium krabiense]MBB5628199.1 D-sedoheptulose 7-phosphate isomerase [Sphaerisporangium krabiense]